MRRHTITYVMMLAGLTGCAVGPDYQRPAMTTPVAYRDNAGWQPAQPQDSAPRGKWWEIYQDSQLNQLEDQVAISNQTVMQATAQYRQARALLDESLAAYWPTLGAKVGSTTTQSTSTMFHVNNANTLDSASLNAGWTVDIWGALRRQVEASRDSAQASAAQLQAALLTAQATLAESYLQLRVVDATVRMLQATVADNQHTLEITQNMFDGGVNTQLDVANATTQVKLVQAQLIDFGVQRAQLEHAIALLMGQPASTFALLAVNSIPHLPTIPVAVPSALLQHRPDIAAAERQMAAANAQIGVAQAAFYPTLNLNGSFGYQGVNFTNLIATPNQFWSVGPALAQTIFNGGLLQAQKAAAVAAYDSAVANYRQVVLTAFQAVENDLATLTILEHENIVQQQAVDSAHLAAQIAENQYEAGTVTYLNVLVAQTTELSAEQTQLGIQERRLVASAGLITDLGAGWQASP